MKESGPIKDLQFMVDAMFGKCGRFLRLLGFDTVIVDSHWNDGEILERIKASKRILITRDSQLYQRCQNLKTKYGNGDIPAAIYCQVENVEDFLVCLFQKLNISPHGFLVSTILSPIDSTPVRKLPFQPRCSLCNSLVHSISLQEAKGQVPEGTTQHFQLFWQCNNANCGKIYWIGDHWSDILNKLKRVEERLKLT